MDKVQLKKRFRSARIEASKVRTSLYHLTNSCNLRCDGCWFFSNDFDKKYVEQESLVRLEEFVKKETARGVNAPLIIGGEPTMFPERIKIYRKYMDKVSISTNGLKKLPYEGFEDITIAISIFGGGVLDDKLRAIGPNGKTFTGLFYRNLKNYYRDSRAGFVYAISTAAIPYMDETIQKIQDNGNRLLLNYYTDYNNFNGMNTDNSEIERLIDKALTLKQKYPDVIVSHPYFIEALIRGGTNWGMFNGDSCPSISVDNTINAERITNSNPYLPGFNAYSADLETTMTCCTSGECNKCRDSQAISSWLLVNLRKIMKEPNGLMLWTELMESYLSQFVWSTYHPDNCAA